MVASGGSLRAPSALDVGVDGAIYAADAQAVEGPGAIIRVDPSTGRQRVVVTGSVDEYGGIVVSPSGEAFFFDRASPHSLVRADLSTGRRSNIVSGGFVVPNGIALMKAAGQAVCADRPTPTISTTRLGTGRLGVSVRVNGASNVVRGITFDQISNAQVESQPHIVGAEASFVVRRTGPGFVTMPYTITDACGPWPTFVGGGPAAF